MSDAETGCRSSCATGNSDRYAQDFPARTRTRVVVSHRLRPRCTLERVDNGQVEWYDLDFPHVIELHRKLIGDERERYHLLALLGA